jgi:UDP-glucose 4-epimerase
MDSPATLSTPSAGLGSTVCVVTGGLGFVGSNLVHALVACGARVRVVDALVPEHGGDARNLADLDGVEVTIAEVGDPRVGEVIADADLIFNVAGQVSHHASMTDPIRDLDLNTRSQVGFLETVRRVRPGARIVLTSTRQVYGRPERLPVDESHPVNPVDVNGIDKLACERFHLLYGRIHGLRPTVLRLTNIYGPRQNLLKDDLGVLPVFVRKALRGEPIQLFGDGSQRRDCLFVDDVVSAMIATALTDSADGEIINIGNTTSWTLREIADAIVAATGSATTVTTSPWPPDLERIDIGDFQCDVSKAARLLNWTPTIDIADGMQRTAAFYGQHPWYLSSI